MDESVSKAAPKQYQALFIPTSQEEFENCNKFSTDIFINTNLEKLIFDSLDHFNVTFVYAPLSFAKKKNYVKLIKERAEESDLVVFIYDTSNSPNSKYHKQFIKNISKFRPGDGGKTYFAFYGPKEEAYVPKVKDKLTPDETIVNNLNIVEACGRALTTAYTNFLKS
jgi:hypothetical protein